MLILAGLLIIVLLSVMITYVLTLDRRGAANRLFALSAAASLLLVLTGTLRLASDDTAIAYVTLAATAPLAGLSSFALAWLILALLLPQRFAQPAARWLIALPYLAVIGAILLDTLLGWGFLFAGIELDPQSATGNYSFRFGPSRPLFAALYIGGLLAPIVMSAAVAARHPERRGLALALCLGLILTAAAAILAPVIGITVLGYLGPLPLYLVCIWAVQHYQLFRPSNAVLETAIESLPDSLLVLDRERRVRYANGAARRQLGAPDAQNPEPFATWLERSGLHVDGQIAGEGRIVRRADAGQADAAPLILAVSAAPVQGDRVASEILLLRDITEAEEQNRALASSSAALQERSAALEAMLREVQERDALIARLSLPMIPTAEGVLVLPLIGSFDAERSKTLVRRALAEIDRSRARFLLVDMTGVTAFDRALAEAVRLTVEGVRLLGAQVALCGIRPDMAESIVHVQVPLENVLLFATLQEGIAAVGQRASR